MRNNLYKIQAAGFALALAFTFSCSGGDDDNGNGGGSVIHGTPVTYEGETYQTVVIGAQTWMAKNLNYNASGSKCYGEGGYIENWVNDEPITRTLSNAEIQANCAKYGRLYSWATAMGIDEKYNHELWGGSDVNHRGICPSGWHLPSNAEWTTLTDFAGGEEIAGTKLKATSGWDIYRYEEEEKSGNWKEKSGNGTDAFGFAGLPGGGRYPDGLFDQVGSWGFWRSASQADNNRAYDRYMYGDHARWLFDGDKDFLISVRCLKD